MPWIKASELNKNQAVNTASVSSGGRWMSASEKKRLEEKQKIIKKSQEEAQKYQAEADKYNRRVGILEGIKSLPKEIGKMAVGTGAMIGDIATRLNPLEGVRNIASGVKTSFQRPEGESAIDAYKRGILESQARPTLYEKAQTKMSGKEFKFPQMDKTAGLPTGLVTQPEYRKALTSAMEAPTYVFGGKPVATAGKGLLARVLSRTVATQPEAIIEAGLATAGEEKPTLKSAGMNYLAATLLMSGISNTVGEIRISRNSKEVTDTKKELEEVYNNELPDEAKDDLAEAFSQGVKKEDILENAKKTIGDTAEEVVEIPETPVKREPTKLKAGEFAPISKEIQETTGKKLTAKETLEVKDKIEEGYTKEEIIDEIINPRKTEPTPKEVKSVVIAEKEKSSFEQTRDAAIKRSKEQDARTQSNGKYSKGTAMEFAGIKRKIEGNPTYKEAEKAKKYLESNHQGKEVVVNGVKGKIEKMSFGRVGVKFGDGTIKFFDKDLVKSEKVTKSNVLDYLKKEGERNLDLYKRLYDIKDTPKRTELTSKPPKVENKVSVLKTAKGERTYKILKEEGITNVQGTPVKIVDGVDTFVHKGTGGWVVSESSTGRYIADSGSINTKESAIKNARIKIKEVGEDKFKKLLSENKLPQPDERQEALDYVKSKSVKFREPTAAGDNIIRHARELSEIYHDPKKRRLETKGGYLEYSIDKDSNEFIIDYVEATEKRKGIGTKLMNAAEKIAEKEGLDVGLVASPQDDVQKFEDLKDFYESLGYENVAEFGDVAEFSKKNADLLFGEVPTKSQKTNHFIPPKKNIENENFVEGDDLVSQAKKYKSAEELRELGGGKLNEKFRVKDDLAKVGIKITDDQEKQIIKLNKSMFGDENIKITEQILTPQGQKALGSYRDGLIKIVKGEADIKDTYYHESFHKYLDVLTTADEQADLLIEARKVSGLKDFGEVEEWLSEKFIGYAKNREGVTGKIKAQFDNVLERIKTYLGNEDKIKKAYSELISGKATKKVTSTTTPTTKTTVKSGESITAKKLNEVMPDEYKINEDYDKITLKGELDRASKEIAKDKDVALRKAFSRDERVDRRIAKLEEFAQIAKDNKDYEAVNRLFTQANKIGTETAQGLNMLKALYAVNPEYKYMQEIINARLANVKFGVKDIEKATKEAREIISRKGKDLKEKTKQAFKVKDAQELLNSIMCK